MGDLRSMCDDQGKSYGGNVYYKTRFKSGEWVVDYHRRWYASFYNYDYGPVGQAEGVGGTEVE